MNEFKNPYLEDSQSAHAWNCGFYAVVFYKDDDDYDKEAWSKGVDARIAYIKANSGFAPVHDKFNNELNFQFKKPDDHLPPIGPTMASEATLLDMFAVQAMVPIMSLGWPIRDIDETNEMLKRLAARSYEMAQAMMDERRSRIA